MQIRVPVRPELDDVQQALQDGLFLIVTAGSTEKPAPNGQLKITSIAKNPTYRYNPDYAFKGVKSRQSFTIKAGPNNPVGVVWIGLNKEGYGIHGTPAPSKVGKSESHGCIRLTNWDATQLAEAATALDRAPGDALFADLDRRHPRVRPAATPRAEGARLRPFPH